MLHSTYQMDCFGISDVGLVRDHNEDVWKVFPENGLFLLADGMGGHAAGEVAAEESVKYLYNAVKLWSPTDQTTPHEAVTFFREVLCKVNTSIYQRSQTEPSLTGMGTTVCALYFLHKYAVIGHVGDSRVYRLRSRRLQQLTEDHSLVSELVSLGAMRAEESETFPYRHILTRAIGTHSTVEPTVNYLTVENNDCFLLCSDGLTNYVSDSEIERFLNQDLSLNEQGQTLVDVANAHGGGDNITLVLVKIHDDLS